jgi:N-acyl-D-aspartate/D-glutamate deacylase
VRADLLLHGGRVVDPASGFDGVADVAVAAGRVIAVGPALDVEATSVVDASGLVVTAGFIDLHSHSHDIAGHRLQALDGCTTVLELEGGLLPVDSAYARVADEGRPLNYGFSTSWGLARMQVIAGHPASGLMDSFLANINDPAWQRLATDDQVAQMLELLERDLAAGALGIGILVGYAPLIGPDEYVAVARLAADSGAPTYTHSREIIESNPLTPIDGAEEIVRAAGETGAHMHYCHINSTSRRHLDRVLGVVGRAQAAGSRVTTEAYPYGAGSTGIGATFLDPDRLDRWGLTPSSIRYMPTGERVASVDRLRELRASDPGGLAIIDFLDENDPVDMGYLQRALAFPNAVVASDAMPLTWSGAKPQPDAWPLPPQATTHPRTAGTFARALRMFLDVLDLSLIEALEKLSYGPARLLEDSIPAMARKGRVEVGADADLLVFDPTTMRDRATYDDSTRTSTGVQHLFVHGEHVVADGELDLDARPGRPVRR